MTFYADDLYTASAGVTIFNYWNPYVTKHDTSSFYNWEQDNLPLYDLEERTYYLWEKFGYPLSAVPSMALLVSSTVPTDSALSSNVFTSLSAAIEALPEVIRMPTLIEVAVSGNIGELNLNNIKCEDDGALEIVNRGFSQLLSTSGALYLSAGAVAPTHATFKVSGLDCVDTISETSALQFSANVSSLFPVAGSAGFYRNFISTKTQINKVSPSHAYAGVADNILLAQTGALNQLITAAIKGPAYATDSSDSTLDFSSTDFRDDSNINGEAYTDQTSVNGWYTANALSKISISNSDGPIYIRGFVVDGSGTSTDVGVHVGSSDGITLEYVGAMRCYEKGFDIHNSKVYLRRGSAASRNYDDTSDSTRYGSDTFGYYIVNSDVELVTDTYTTEQDFCLFSNYQDYGLYAVNSNINYSSDSVDTTSNTNAGTLSLLEASFNINNKAGVELHNSKLEIDGLVNACQNDYGVKLYGSVFSPARLLVAGNQKNGLDVNSSVVRLNSYMGAMPALLANPSNTWNSQSSTRYAPFTYIKNGKHIHVGKGSKYFVDWPASGNICDQVLGGHYLLEHHGVNKVGSDIISTPGVVVEGEVDVLGWRAFSENPQSSTNTVIKGLLLRVQNGGSFRSAGVLNAEDIPQTSVNTFSGPRNSTSRRISAVHAENNSTVDLQGINAILHTGVGVMCDNNSVLNVTPIKDSTNSSYLLSSTMLGAASSCATVLEVHSTRAGLVADNNSEINLIDLGNYRDLWDVSLINTNDVYTDADYIPLYADFIASGGVQFFPNAGTAVDQLDLTDATNSNSNYTSVANYQDGGDVTFDSDISGIRMVYEATYNGFASNATDYTQGGECVKALGGSRVTVKNVNFYTGFNNPDDSYYDASASPAGCNNLHIWNIADDSKLHASYISVSGTYPSLAGYTGPRSFYKTSDGELGLGDDSSAVAYAIPDDFISVDTGNMSVLDHFGSGVEVSAGKLSSQMSSLGQLRTGLTGQYYGPNSYLNSGPFRLYFSVNPVVKHFAYVDLLNASADANDNKPFQHLSQGYLLSGAVSAVAAASSTWDNILIYNTETSSYDVSGYFYPSSVGVEPDPNNIWLDESAANAFANAKNATITYSGRKKYLNIYRATTTAQGESHVADTSGLGEGFMTSNIFDLGRKF